MKSSLSKLKLSLRERPWRLRHSLWKRRKIFEDFKWRSRLSRPKSTTWRHRSNQRMFICSVMLDIRDCTQILWNTIQISFVHKLVITNFGTLGRTISTSHLFLPKSRFPSPNKIFFKETMTTKNVTSQASNKNTGSLPQRSRQVGTIPKRRVRGMKTRSMAKAITVVVVRQTIIPSPKNKACSKKCLVGWTEPKAPQSSQLRFVN